MHWSRIACFIVVPLAVFALSACSGHKVLTSDDLRSELFSANSYASEIEMFIDYVRQGHATKRFAETHALQVAKEIAHSEQELAAATPEPQDAKPFESCEAEFGFLRRELPIIPTLMGNDDALWAERGKVAASHQRLAAAASTL
ncbi:MAG TPA: hypothetical protein VJO35_09780 [Terriglobales bacterium]|nr:hypothetical protein [Terriglobales bacterium]